jgi:type IV secretion system protein VirB1
MLDCPNLSVPQEVMQHVVHVESSRNPFAIGVVGGYLAKQPKTLEEALAAVRQLKQEGYNFSVGIAQVNRYNLAKYGLNTYAEAFEACSNLRAGSRILRECYDRAQDWGKAFSCYYSGNFATGFDHGYVQKIFASMRKAQYSAAGQPENVRIIPYNSNPRKIVREDNVPLRGGPVAPLSSAPPEPLPPATGRTTASIPGAQQTAYPEPYAIRKYLPLTPLYVTAAAMSQSQKAFGRSAAETAEDRPAIPVPGPGALMPESSSVAANRAPSGGLSHIPTQVVGVNGDPYRTRILPPSGGTTGVPGNQLPLPDLNTQLPQPGPNGSRKPTNPSASNTVAARKGGSLLSANESSGKPENTAHGAKPVDDSQQSGEKKSASSDGSFVF